MQVLQLYPPQVSASIPKVKGSSKDEKVVGMGGVQSSADIDVVFGERADVSWPFVVVDDFFMVETGEGGCLSERSCCAKSCCAKHRQCLKLKRWRKGRNVDDESQGGGKSGLIEFSGRDLAVNPGSRNFCKYSLEWGKCRVKWGRDKCKTANFDCGCGHINVTYIQA